MKINKDFKKKSKLTSEAMEVFLGPTEISERQPTTNLTKVINYQHFYVHNARWKSNRNHHMWWHTKRIIA